MLFNYSRIKRLSYISKGMKRKEFKKEKKLQLTFEQHRFELNKSTYTWIFFN